MEKTVAAEKAKPEDKNVSDRQKALDTALAQIERQFGKGSVMKMSDRQAQVIEVIPTGSVALDVALGIGGLPRGRIIEIYGPESSGKTTLTLHAIANAQKAGGICAFIDAEHAFDLFYQGHSSTFKGTGLGLSLSKELIHAHNGTIVINSKKNHGTSFTITLPFEQNKTNQVLNDIVQNDISKDNYMYTSDILPHNYEKVTKVQLDNVASILIIEDNDDLREFLRNRLEGTYEILTANDGNDGINKAFDIVPDLIISDIIMPGLSGLKIAETLKNDLRTSHIPIILLTAKSSIEDQIEGMKLYADMFITKPFNLNYLEESIISLLKNRTILREHFISEIPSESRSNTSNKLDRKFISEFTSIIESNLSNEDLSVDDIYKGLGISKIQLYRKTKALLGFNVNDYILSVRLQKAKYLLINEDLSISEIAYKVGFSSQAYFSTVFKSKFSITPSEFKESSKR